jgi:hypothetical protein
MTAGSQEQKENKCIIAATRRRSETGSSAIPLDAKHPLPCGAY